VKAYRDKELATKAPSPSLWLGLSSRRNLCIHPLVSEEKDNSHVDAKCRNMTASFVRERAKIEHDVELCQFYEGFESFGKDIHLNGVYTLEDLRNFGNARTICPYFLARHSVQLADVLVFSYQYVIDPKISEIVTKDVKNCILVFDEAHNIDNVCIDALSININRNILEASQRNITRLSTQIAELPLNTLPRYL
jgi:DNA excision repair protein ERCC-2